MTTEHPYIPISCDQHSILELLAMRQNEVSARWIDVVRQMQTTRGRVIDVLTREGAEYLVLIENDNERVSIRLDRLVELLDASADPIWRQKSD